MRETEDKAKWRGFAPPRKIMSWREITMKPVEYVDFSAHRKGASVGAKCLFSKLFDVSLPLRSCSRRSKKYRVLRTVERRLARNVITSNITVFYSKKFRMRWIGLSGFSIRCTLIFSFVHSHCGFFSYYWTTFKRKTK